jgi:predicted  nucleic acid-binding Zn-ribbon protein|tara:strand:- start:21 stop:254 length:234 start_codon:yes stop_codon:yes gene_type:complete
MAKITEEQLKKVVEQNKELEDTVLEIGILESKKHALLHKVADVNKVLEESKKELEEEYGKISIDLKTGEYTEITEEA